MQTKFFEKGDTTLMNFAENKQKEAITSIQQS